MPIARSKELGDCLCALCAFMRKTNFLSQRHEGHKDRPASASLDSWVDLYLGPLVFAILAAGFLFFGIVFFATGLGKAKNRGGGEETQNSEEEPAAP